MDRTIRKVKFVLGTKQKKKAAFENVRQQSAIVAERRVMRRNSDVSIALWDFRPRLTFYSVQTTFIFIKLFALVRRRGLTKS